MTKTQTVEATPVAEAGASTIPDPKNAASAPSPDSLPEWMPKPVGYSLLVAMPQEQEKTDGGVYIPDELKKREQLQSQVAYVMASGVEAYCDVGKFPYGPWCKPGDWVLIKAYSGTRFTIKTEKGNQEFRLINDDQVQAVCPEPGVVKRAA
jgi:co-chaperonin GroES (HSP10)